ncbi:hypothetical protein GCM10023148_31420 [Actinokineospora soli]
MSEVLLLAVRFDDEAVAEPSAGVVTVHHPSGRRFLVAEITDDDPAAAPEAQASIW